MAIERGCLANFSYGSGYTLRMDEVKKPQTAEEFEEWLRNLQGDLGGGLEDGWRKEHEEEKEHERRKERSVAVTQYLLEIAG